jgi:hypothetical protein
MKNLAAFLACFWIFSCQAFTCDKPITGLHTNTYHTDRSANYRENNMGQYFICENGFTAGSYNNSDWKHSDYVGYSKEFGYAKITFALISGYQIEPIAAVIPSIKIPGTPISVAYLPQAPNKNNDTTGWHITIETSFK